MGTPRPRQFPTPPRRSGGRLHRRWAVVYSSNRECFSAFVRSNKNHKKVRLHHRPRSRQSLLEAVRRSGRRWCNSPRSSPGRAGVRCTPRCCPARSARRSLDRVSSPPPDSVDKAGSPPILSRETMAIFLRNCRRRKFRSSSIPPKTQKEPRGVSPRLS